MLNGKIAIVTGGTRGIGLAVVRTFLHNGAKVALFGSREASVQRALAQLREEQPDWPVMGLWPDLTDYAAVERAVQEVAQTFGGVDILVNNAGISAREPLADYSPEAFRSIMDLNVTAVFHGCKAVEPIMRAAGKGCIINTSSMVSLYGQPSGVGYPASKFAVNGLTRSLARELGRAGIRVNAVAPGVTRTDMVAALPRGLRDYPHSDALHPIYVFRNAFLTCFFKKFQKNFRQMRDKYHYKAYVAFRMRENCTECRSDNSGSPIQYPIWPRPVSGRSYPPLPQKAASVWMHALSLS